MNCTRRSFLALLSMTALSPLAACSSSDASGAPADGNDEAAGTALPAGALAFDNAAWNYDADNDAYWQIGVTYCERPAAPAYESLGLFVPGAYLNGTDNGDGTFTCEVNEEGRVAGFGAATAPVVMPVNTAGYSAQPAPTGYSYGSVADYLEAGFVYAYAGCRGRDNGYNEDGSLAFSGGAPWGATDLKAAVRYLRYNAAVLPGNMDAVFTFGHSGGGAQSAVMGASGDSVLYEPYLESIGAAMSDASGTAISDAVAGAMCWCPITCLDEADAAYEWMMGQYVEAGARADGVWTAALSGDLAEAYAAYINEMGFKDASGQKLALQESSGSLFAGGSYYDRVLATIEESLNNFLADTEFPYAAGGQSMADGGFGGGLGEGPSADGAAMGAAEGAPGEMPDGAAEGMSGQHAAEGAPSGAPGMEGAPSGAPDGEGGPSGASESATYETVQDYLDSLNADEEWIAYDAASNTATVASVSAFVRRCKSPSKDVGAFDALDRSQAENKVFGNDESNALHFDATMARLLQDNAEGYAAFAGWDPQLPLDYADDREQLDVLGTTVDTRAGMYNPLYYLCDRYDGAGTSSVAPHWRIRTGIEQGDTSLTTEMNLALALERCDEVSDVDFATVWGQGHTTAERTGDSTANFIAWVKERCF